MLWGKLMITRYKHKIDQPYSLHDMVVNKIENRGGNLHLQFEHGFVITQDPYPQVEGNIIIEEIDEDFCCVLLLSKLGQYGEFKGEKLSVRDFLNKYEGYKFEIVDEMYGYNQVEYLGYLTLSENVSVIQTVISIYFAGDIVYEVTESKEAIEAKVEELKKAQLKISENLSR